MNEPTLAPAEELQAEPPHKPAVGYRPLLWLAIGILIAFAAISVFALSHANISDETKGGIIITWNNLAIMVAGFWFGSNVASKVSSLTGRK